MEKYSQIYNSYFDGGLPSDPGVVKKLLTDLDCLREMCTRDNAPENIAARMAEAACCTITEYYVGNASSQEFWVIKVAAIGVIQSGQYLGLEMSQLRGLYKQERLGDLIRALKMHHLNLMHRSKC